MTPLRFYFDDNCGDRRWVAGLQRLGVEVTRSVEAGLYGADDGAHLAFATEHAWCLVTSDVSDFTRLSAATLAAGLHHAGIVIAFRGALGPGDAIRALAAMAGQLSFEEMQDRVEYLSRWAEAG